MRDIIRSTCVTQIATIAAREYLQVLQPAVQGLHRVGLSTVYALALRWWLAHPQERPKAWAGPFSPATGDPRNVTVSFPATPLGRQAYAELQASTHVDRRKAFGPALDLALRSLPTPAAADVLLPYFSPAAPGRRREAPVGMLRFNRATAGKVQALASAWGMFPAEVISILVNSHPILHDVRLTPLKIMDGARTAAVAPPAPDGMQIEVQGLGGESADAS